jgi:hypothetical protein
MMHSLVSFFPPCHPHQEPDLKRWTVQYKARDYLTLTTCANHCSWPVRNNHLLLRKSHFPADPLAH